MDWNKVLEFISNLWNNIFLKVLVSTLVFILLWWLSTMIVNKTKKRALKRGKTDKLITIVIFNCILWGIRIFLVIVGKVLVLRGCGNIVFLGEERAHPA